MNQRVVRFCEAVARVYRCFIVRCTMALCYTAESAFDMDTGGDDDSHPQRPRLVSQPEREVVRMLSPGETSSDQPTTSSGPPPPPTPPHPLPPPTLFEWDEWTRASSIPGGKYGNVCVYTHTTVSNTRCVIKKEKKSRRTKSETACLQQCSHGHIVQYLGSRVHKGQSQLAMAYCPGMELFDYIVDTTDNLPVPLVNRLSAQLLEAVRYLHSKRIMHRDIKPENIMFNPDTGNLQLVDFGFACQWHGDNDRRYSYVGTPYYTAHEMVCKNACQSYTSLVDEWSVGVVVYVMMYGVPPFYGETDEAIFRSIENGVVSFPEDARSTDAVACIRGLLDTLPTRRHTAAVALCQPWFTGGRSPNP